MAAHNKGWVMTSLKNILTTGREALIFLGVILGGLAVVAVYWGNTQWVTRAEGAKQMIQVHANTRTLIDVVAVHDELSREIAENELRRQHDVAESKVEKLTAEIYGLTSLVDKGEALDRDKRRVKLLEFKLEEAQDLLLNINRKIAN